MNEVNYLYGVHGGKCDPQKASNCPKTMCNYIKDENGKPRGQCTHTTNPRWIKEK